MTQLTPISLISILGQVTAILFVTMLGGAVAGIVLDRTLGTTPLLFLVGFGVGNLLAIVGIGLLIRNGRRKLSAPAVSGPAADTTSSGSVRTRRYDDA